MRARLAALLSATLLGVLAGAACRPRYDPKQPVDGAPESCCKFANTEMTAFAGCRMAHRCHSDEPIWLRGRVKCTAVDEAKCKGGRCCELQPMYGTPDSPLNWDGGDAKAPPEPTPAPETPRTPAPTPETAPEPTPETTPPG